jgi:hypothetical protein
MMGKLKVLNKVMDGFGRVYKNWTLIPSPLPPDRLFSPVSGINLLLKESLND